MSTKTKDKASHLENSVYAQMDASQRQAHSENLNSFLNLKGGQYNEFQAKYFRQNASHDPTSQVFANELEKIEMYVQRAAEGGINKRRSLIYRDVEQMLASAINRYHGEMNNQAEQYQELFNKHVKERTGKTAEQRLADYHETQARIRAMEDSELEGYLSKANKRPEITFKSTAFKSPVEYDLVLSEMKSRDMSTDLLRDSMKGVPRDAIGDHRAALMIDKVNEYRNIGDHEAVKVKDEAGKPIAFSVEALIDLSGLEAVPE